MSENHTPKPNRIKSNLEDASTLSPLPATNEHIKMEARNDGGRMEESGAHNRQNCEQTHGETGSEELRAAD